jgi:hypothetical protein
VLLVSKRSYGFYLFIFYLFFIYLFIYLYFFIYLLFIYSLIYSFLCDLFSIIVYKLGLLSDDIPVI